MSKQIIDTYHTELMNIADYSNIKTLKILFKLYFYLRKEEEKGNTTASAIRLDLDHALENIGADYRNIIYSILICGDTYQEFMNDHGIALGTVHNRLYNALKASIYILEGEDDTTDD